MCVVIRVGLGLLTLASANNAQDWLHNVVKAKSVGLWSRPEEKCGDRCVGSAPPRAKRFPGKTLR